MSCKAVHLFHCRREGGFSTTVDEKQDVPAVIDCPVGYRENTMLTKRMQELIRNH